MLKPKDPIASKPAAAKKTRASLRDLAPRKEPRGGYGLQRNDPPLPIPPPGFIMNADGEKDGRK